MLRIPPSLSDPRVLVSAGLVGAVTGLVVGSAVAAGGDRPETAGPPAALRLAITDVEPSLRPRFRPDLSLALFGFAAPRPRASRELQCLTEAVYYEARGESEAGQAAVAQVVLNRTQRPGYPKSVCGVVFQRSGPACQFSFACDTSVTGRREPAAWRRAERVASRALEGHVATEVGRATHYHVAGLETGWRGLSQVARIGAHVFYAVTGHAAPKSAPSPRMVQAETEADPADMRHAPASAAPAAAITPASTATAGPAAASPAA